MTTTPTGAASASHEHGIDPGGAVVWNPTTAQLYEHALEAR